MRSGFVTLNGVVVDKDTQPALARLLEVGVLCNNSHLQGGQVLGQATEGALLVAAAKMGIEDLRGMCACEPGCLCICACICRDASSAGIVYVCSFGFVLPVIFVGMCTHACLYTRMRYHTLNQE